jgi:exosortase
MHRIRLGAQWGEEGLMGGFVLASVALLAFYAQTLARLWHAWRVDSYAGHVMLVPAFSLVLLWTDRGQLRGGTRAHDSRGWGLLAVGLGLLGVGAMAGSLALRALSLPVSVAGLVIAFFGAATFRAVWFPIAFLAFMAPLPRSVVAVVTHDIQAFVAWMAGGVVSLLGLPVYQQGTVLQLSTTTLEVAEACNGLRFLMALLVLAAAYAYVSQRTWTRGLVLVASAIPVAVLANAVRVSAIAVAAHFYGAKAASGLIHHSIGKSVWAVTLLALWLIGRILKGHSESKAAGSLPAGPEGSPVKVPVVND